jgi:hypothetical protein
MIQGFRKINKILDREFSDLYYESNNDLFYVPSFKGVNKFRPIKWNTVVRRYASKKNPDEKTLYYKYVILPTQLIKRSDQRVAGIRPAMKESNSNCVRLSLKDWEIMKNSNNMVAFE